MLSLEPKDLTVQQAERMCDLREKFDDTMPEGASPMPRFPLDSEDLPVQRESASSSTTPPSAGRNKQPKPKETREQGTQVDLQPAFTRVPSVPPPTREVIAGPFFQVPGRDHLHVYRECWGLRHAGNVQRVTMCRCCVENGGNRIY